MTQIFDTHHLSDSLAKFYPFLTSNQSVGLACKLPYPGWKDGFKPAIMKLMSLIADTGVVEVVDRFSLKYTSIFPGELGPPSSVIKFRLQIGPYDLGRNLFQIRVEIPKDNLISIVQIWLRCTVPDLTTKKGVPIDIDTIFTGWTFTIWQILRGAVGWIRDRPQRSEVYFLCVHRPGNARKNWSRYMTEIQTNNFPSSLGTSLVVGFIAGHLLLNPFPSSVEAADRAGPYVDYALAPSTLGAYADVFVTARHAAVSGAAELQSFYASLLAKQERLGSEFEAALFGNLWNRMPADCRWLR